MNITLLSLSLASCLLLAANAQAADYPLEFEELDRDASGYITPDEANVREDLNKNFAAIDTDGNGKLNIAEYQAYEGKGRFEPPEDSETPELGAAPTR